MSSGWSSSRSRRCPSRARSSTPRTRGSKRPAEARSRPCSSRGSPTPSTSSPRSAATSAGERARVELEGRGITVHASVVDGPQRHGFTYVDDAGERTITTIGRKLHPRGPRRRPAVARARPLRRCLLLRGRRGRALARASQRASSSRLRASCRRLRQAAIELDALVSSGKDEAERYQTGQLDPEPRLVVTTSGALGGWAQPGGPYSAAELPRGPCGRVRRGDCFAAGLAFALASGLEGLDALDFAARCGAGALAGPGVHAEAVPLAPVKGLQGPCGAQGLRSGGKWSKVGLRGRSDPGGDHVLRHPRAHDRREEPPHPAREVPRRARRRNRPPARDRPERRRLPAGELVPERRAHRRPRLAHARGAQDEALRLHRGDDHRGRQAGPGGRAARSRRQPRQGGRRRRRPRPPRDLGSLRPGRPI